MTKLIIPETEQPIRCCYEYRWSNYQTGEWRSYRCTNFHAPNRFTCTRNHFPMQCAPLADGWPDESDTRFERWPSYERQR